MKASILIVGLSLSRLVIMSPSFYLVSSGHQLQDRLQPTYLLFVQCSENSRWFSSQSQIWNFEADGSRRSARCARCQR
ncbi:hypothetical protein EDB84DRAFT_1526227 [Lactarius hengduanensis]|nr:hypothetical protein EDB84DRAFT_1526227 [Lactarius hengduanensis]KAH9021786.1 hypothetical protein EDB85DRAFT_1998951 [Lactarius pseudohatsudake]